MFHRHGQRSDVTSRDKDNGHNSHEKQTKFYKDIYVSENAKKERIKDIHSRSRKISDTISNIDDKNDKAYSNECERIDQWKNMSPHDSVRIHIAEHQKSLAKEHMIQRREDYTDLWYFINDHYSKADELLKTISKAEEWEKSKRKQKQEYKIKSRQYGVGNYKDPIHHKDFTKKPDEVNTSSIKENEQQLKQYEKDVASAHSNLIQGWTRFEKELHNSRLIFDLAPANPVIPPENQVTPPAYQAPFQGFHDSSQGFYDSSQGFYEN